eukprot:m.82566 g.82566  ORF g.82566 m.82566 type:complete len:251 (-) comp25530_c0_seq1:187-939(-)
MAETLDVRGHIITSKLEMLGFPPPHPPNISVQKLQKAYKQTARRLHPDKNPDDNTAAEKFVKAKAAYDFLLAHMLTSSEFNRRFSTSDPTPKATSMGPQPAPQSRHRAHDTPSERCRQSQRVPDFEDTSKSAAFASFRASTTPATNKPASHSTASAAKPPRVVVQPRRNTSKSHSGDSWSSTYNVNHTKWGHACGGCAECLAAAQVPTEAKRKQAVFAQFKHLSRPQATTTTQQSRKMKSRKRSKSRFPF